MEINKDIQSTKKVINFTIYAYVILHCYGLYALLVNDNLTYEAFVSIGIGVFIIYSLIKAKEWAKFYISISCSIIIIFSMIIGIIQITHSSWPYAIVNILVAFWAAYLIRFLNVNDRYDRYAKVVKSGFNTNNKEIIDIHNIISEDRLLLFDRRTSVHPIHYKKLIEDLLDSDKEIMFQIEEIRALDGSIVIETTECEYEIGFDPDAVFFQDSFIDKFNMVLDQNQTNRIVTIVYPLTTAFRKQTKLALLSEAEFVLLKTNGMIQ